MLFQRRFYLFIFFLKWMAISVAPAYSKTNRTDSYIAAAQRAYKKNLYFTSATFLKYAINQGGEINYRYAKFLDDVIDRTNIFIFLDIPFDYLKNINTSENVSFVIGKKYFFKKDYQNAIVYFKKITSKSSFYLSATYHLAALYQILGQEKESAFYTKKCLIDAKKSKSKLDYKSLKIVEQEVEYINDSCESLKARHYYKFKNYTLSQKAFKEIPINSYIFPQSLFESSWLYLIQWDFMRAVGKNLTFQAPVMNNYFIPEAELVKLLSYIELCYWDDALELIRTFDKNVKSKVSAFIREFNLGSRGSYQFAQLFTNKSQRDRLGNTFFNRLLDVIWVRPGFQTIRYYLQQINNEKQIVDRAGSKWERRAFQSSYTDFIEFFNDFVKVRMVGLAKSIIKVSNIFAEIELDIYSSMKYQLYSAKAKGTSPEFKERIPFYVRNISRNSRQHYWNFTGEFWADELGSYIPYLESLCGVGNNAEALLDKDTKPTSTPAPGPSATSSLPPAPPTDQIYNSDGSQSSVDNELPPPPPSENASPRRKRP